jgi:asparagine synthetase B (glutamine-hydrolysing)
MALRDVVYSTVTPHFQADHLDVLALAECQLRGSQVVLIGEGPDEFLLSYDLIKETAVRRFRAYNFNSTMQRLTRFLCVYLPDGHRAQRGLELALSQCPHRVRDLLIGKDLLRSKAARLQSYLPQTMHAQFVPDVIKRQFEQHFFGGVERCDWNWNWNWNWDRAVKAPTLDVMAPMTPHIPRLRQERTAMACALERHCPFLDHGLTELVDSFRLSFMLRTLGQDRRMLRRIDPSRVSATIAQRPNVSYRAPLQVIVYVSASRFVDNMPSSQTLRDAGLFTLNTAGQLLKPERSGAGFNAMDELEVLGIFTTPVWHRRFIQARQPLPMR